MFKLKKKISYFTLIELVVVIVVIGILAAIVIPNTQSAKEDAIRAEIVSNTRNLQTIVDAYALKHEGEVPTKEQPSFGNPQFLDFEALYTDYSKTKKPNNGYYWVDSNNQVWGAGILPPSKVMTQGNEFAWEGVPHASGYEVFTTSNNQVTSNVLNNGWLKSLSFLLAGKSVEKVTVPEGSDGMFVSAYDKYGLSTPPVGENYFSESGFPVTGEVTFSIVTNAHGTAVWDGINSVENKPVGTDILYQFATSDNGKDYTSFQDTTEGLKNSQYLKVKVQLKGNNNQYPTLYSLKVRFHLLNKEEVFFVPFNNMTTQEIPLLEEGYVEEVSIVGSYSKENRPTMKFKTINSTGVSSQWSYFEKSLPKGTKLIISQEFGSGSGGGVSDDYMISGFLIKTSATEPSSLASSPLPEELNVKTGVKETTPVVDVVDDKWETITSFNVTEDATDEGDWIKVDTVENNPTGTRIMYTYHSSSDGVNWSNGYTEVSEVPNSRFLKVGVTMQREKGVSETPQLFEMTIHYNGLDGKSRVGKKIFSSTVPSQYTSVPDTPLDLSKYNKVVMVNGLKGNDTTGDGTLEKPYQTIQKAFAMALQGDAVFLEGTFTLGQGFTFKSGIDIIGNKEKTILKGSQYNGNNNTVYRLVFDGSGFNEGYTFRGINFNFNNVVYKNQYSADGTRELVTNFNGTYQGYIKNSLFVSGNWTDTTYAGATLTGSGNATNNGNLSTSVFGVRNATYNSIYELTNSSTINQQYGVYSGTNSWYK